MTEPDPADEWPRILRPLIRRGWWPRGGRPSYVLIMVVAASPIALAIALFLAPAVLIFVAVRWVFRRLGAWDGSSA
jgi:hypothetical protein